MSEALPLSATDEDDVELALCDVSLARAFWEGVPAARMLARARLYRDEHDLVDVVARATGAEVAHSSWDTLMARLLASSPSAHERVKRSIARHARPASDEGPLGANDAAIAALVCAVLSADDADASAAEGAASPAHLEASVRVACGSLDERLGSTRADPRAAPFEACLAVATSETIGTYELGDLRRILDQIARERHGGHAIIAAPLPLYPWGENDVPVAERRTCVIARADLERTLLGPERELAAIIARLTPAPFAAQMVSAVTDLLSRRGAILLVAKRPPRSLLEMPLIPPSSWLPGDFSAIDAASQLAAALERGATTAPRVRAVILRAGDAALDALGAEMLCVSDHPFASATFAEILAQASREKDVVRLVSYFAMAPDPSAAAQVLSRSTVLELPGVLRGWLESIPRETSSTARVEACIAALEPYPHLYQAVSSLLSRSSKPPPSA